MSKRRILNERLAAIVATMRHGEMIFIGDAGSGFCKHALYPLDESVEYLDLGVVTGSPTTDDVVQTLVEAGDFEGAVIPLNTKAVNSEWYTTLVEIFGDDKIHEVNYAPDFYFLRNRCNAMVQTGDYGIGKLAILIAGYSSADIDMRIVTGKDMLISDENGFNTMPKEEFNKKYNKDYE